MQIQLTFNDYEDMEAFCLRVSQGKATTSTKPAKKPAPVKEEVTEPVKEEAPVKEEVAEEVPFEEAPAKEEASDITIEQVREKLAGLQKAGKRDEVKALIKSFGAKSLTELPASEYPELMRRAEEM